MFDIDKGMSKRKVTSHPAHETSGIRYLDKKDERGRNSSRDSSGVFAKTYWYGRDARAFEQALQVTGPHCSDVRIKEDVFIA